MLPGMKTRTLALPTTLVASLLACGYAAAAAAPKAPKPVKVTVNFITEKGVGKRAGTITLRETADGIELDTNLSKLPPGDHGFHLHENPSCAPAEKDGTMTAGQAAGAHYDPDATKAHKGPGGGGHKGDLPKLVVGEKGSVKEKLSAPGLKLEDVMGRSIMIHAGGDNYSDQPAPLGGGGARIACGVIPAAKGAAAAGKGAAGKDAGAAGGDHAGHGHK